MRSHNIWDLFNWHSFSLQWQRQWDWYKPHTQGATLAGITVLQVKYSDIFNTEMLRQSQIICHVTVKGCWDFVTVHAYHIIDHLTFPHSGQIKQSVKIWCYCSVKISAICIVSSQCFWCVWWCFMTFWWWDQARERAQDWGKLKTNCQIPLQRSEFMAHWTVVELTSGTVKMTTKIASPWMIPTAHDKGSMSSLLCQQDTLKRFCDYIVLVLDKLKLAVLADIFMHRCVDALREDDVGPRGHSCMHSSLWKTESSC